MIQRSTPDDPRAPSAIMIIGPSETADTFEQHYYDSRGVARVYKMTLSDGVWRLWREAPGFWQRYSGRLSKDGSRIDGAWEKSADGSLWDLDFKLSYIRLK